MNLITSDEELFKHAAQAQGRVVLVTGQVHTFGGHPKLIPFSYLTYRWRRRTRSRGSDSICDERVPRSLPPSLLSASAITRSLIPCFSCRANVVIGDVYVSGAQHTIEEIGRLPPGSGKAFWKRCDVTNWEEQVALFEFAVSRFGGVDIVVSVRQSNVQIRRGFVDLVHPLSGRTIDRRRQDRRNPQFGGVTSLGRETRQTPSQDAQCEPHRGDI